jgi:hypothetical protein
MAFGRGFDSWDCSTAAIFGCLAVSASFFLDGETRWIDRVDYVQSYHQENSAARVML